MTQAVLVFSFPEPQDSISLGLIIEAAKKVFDNMPEMKIHLGIRDAADSVIAVFNPLHEEESNLVKHARAELELIGEDPEFAKSLIEAVRAFSSFGHSGGSQQVGVSMLMELLNFKNLGPLTDNPDEWMRHEENVWPEPGGVWQNKRNGEAFSKDGGKTYTLLSEKQKDPALVKIHHSAKFGEEE